MNSRYEGNYLAPTKEQILQAVNEWMEDGDIEPENERYKNCPEMFFLGETVVKELIKRGVDDGFLKDLEETIKGIEKETITKKNVIPNTEMYDLTRRWFENEMRSYYREPNDEEFMEKLSELYIRLKAKEKVQSYLEESYDTIEEIR